MVERVRASHAAEVAELDARISAKLEQAERNREADLHRKLESLQKHFDKISVGQATANKLAEERSEKAKATLAAKESQVEKKEEEKVEKEKVQKRGVRRPRPLSLPRRAR